MKIKTTKEIEIEAGDLIEWRGYDSKIVFVVVTLDEGNINQLVGISIYDTRKIRDKNVHRPHIVNFTQSNQMTLLAKAKDVHRIMLDVYFND